MRTNWGFLLVLAGLGGLWLGCLWWLVVHGLVALVEGLLKAAL